jgi:TolB protein
MRASRTFLGLCLAAAFVSGSVAPAFASFPGDNGEIAFLRYGRGALSLRTVHPDGSNGRVITRAQPSVDVEWSPDGASYLLSFFGGNERIVEVDAASGARTRIVRLSEIPGDVFGIESVAYGPVGDAVVFCVIGGQESLYTIGVDGSDLSKVSDREDCYADWSATDRIVAVNKDRRIVTMDPDGGERQVAVHSPSLGRGLAVAPSWSPDGSHIVYSARVADRRHDLFLVEGDGNGWQRLTDTDRSEYAPVFSPDGTRVAFTRSGKRPFRGVIDLFSIGMDGADRLRLTATPNRREFTRSWQALLP